MKYEPRYGLTPSLIFHCRVAAFVPLVALPFLALAAQSCAGPRSSVISAPASEASKRTPTRGPSADSPTGLDYFDHGFPRLHHFRISESTVRNGKYKDYAGWCGFFCRYDGVEGKVLNEELVNEGVKPYFDRYKAENPRKMVLLHFNGRTIAPGLPRSPVGLFFAGHWMHRQGSKSTAEILATTTTVAVASTTPFVVNGDIVLTAVLPDGKPDWNRAEQCHVVSVDAVGRTLVINRGRRGTAPLKLAAGQAYLAPHVSPKTGPNPGWTYNFSTSCPRDEHGKNASDVLSDYIGSLLGPGGTLESYDGVVFDVLDSQPKLGKKAGFDTDGDGKVDVKGSGYDLDYLRGTYEFARMVRQKVGPDKLLMADGQNDEGNQRNFDLFNGIESEGWPESEDPDLVGWSTGVNRHLFWMQNAYQSAGSPRFSYIYTKYQVVGTTDVILPITTKRHVFAMAQMLDAGLTLRQFPGDIDPWSGNPNPDWDELVKGQDATPNWLGMPVGPPVRMAKKAPDLLGGSGVAITDDFLARLSGAGMTFTKEGDRVKVSSSGGPIRFSLGRIVTQGRDLTMFVTIKVEPLAGVPVGVACYAKVALAAPGSRVHTTFANAKDFEASFYYRDVTGIDMTYNFTVEGTEPVWLSGVTVHAAPDAMLREFDHGVVLANPAEAPYTFDLAGALPGRSLVHIRGTAGQDPKTNDGSAVGATVQLAARDGLFLTKR